MRFTAETRGAWNAKIHPGLHEGVDVPRTDDFLQNQTDFLDAQITKFSYP